MGGKPNEEVGLGHLSVREIFTTRMYSDYVEMAHRVQPTTLNLNRELVA